MPLTLPPGIKVVEASGRPIELELEVIRSCGLPKEDVDVVGERGREDEGGERFEETSLGETIPLDRTGCEDEDEC